MSGKQNNLTDKEIEDLQNITTDTLASICTMADKHNIDRNSMLKYFAYMLAAFTKVASIQNYETNRTCNCQHKSNSRDDEPCCRCDSRQTNADRIRNMADEELAEFIHKMEITCFVDIIGYANKDCGQGKISCRECRAKAPTILEWLQSEVKVEESEEK